MKPCNIAILNMAAQDVLVTGGARFIGNHLINRLTLDGRKVSVLDNLSAGKTENLPKQIRENSVVFAEGDVRDRSLVKELSSKTEAIVHLVTNPRQMEKVGEGCKTSRCIPTLRTQRRALKSY